MNISELLKKANIILKSQARNKWNVIDELVDLAVKNRDLLPENKDSVKKALYDREKSMSTAIGNGVAIPHCTSMNVQDLVFMLAISQEGIDFDAIDNQPVKIIILIVVPKNKLTQHIKTLANIARMMNNDSLRNRLLNFKTPESILKAVREYDSKA